MVKSSKVFVLDVGVNYRCFLVFIIINIKYNLHLPLLIVLYGYTNTLKSIGNDFYMVDYQFMYNYELLVT